MALDFGLTTAAGAAGKASTSNKQPRNGPDPATSIRFHLKFDHGGLKNIGWWNSFEGLGMETAILQLEEGGNNSYVHQLPTRIKYSNVKLTRPINEDSGKVAVWFMAISKQVVRGATAQIMAVGTDNKPIAQWSLMDVVPVRWTGPSFNVESPKVATETLELAFHGFQTPVAGPGSGG